MKKIVLFLCFISSIPLDANAMGFISYVFGYGETKEIAIQRGKKFASSEGCSIHSMIVEFKEGQYIAQIAVSNCDDDDEWPY